MRRRGAAAFAGVMGLLIATGSAADSHEDDDFFFVHVSDVHAYHHSSEVLEHYGTGADWIPRSVVAWFLLRNYEDLLVPRYSRGILPALRTAMGIAPEDESFFDLTDASRYFAALLDPEGDLGRADAQIRDAFAEIRSLSPAFVVNTGDIVFDSGKVPAEVSARWAALYLSAIDIGIPFHHTIGNHELGFVHHEGVDPEAADYGPGWFRKHFGASPAVFQRGAFRFVSVDTHSRDEDGGWRFNRMRPEVRDWLEAELAENRDAVTMIMNHEPFFDAPEWQGDEDDADRNIVGEDDLLAEYDVDYTLSGHIHLPAVGRSGSTTHIANGALSGMHWLLPPDAAPRGYRLMQASGRSLYSVFKETGEPAFGFVCPTSDPDLFAVCGEASGVPRVVVVASDAAGPLRNVTLEVDGVPIPLEFVGDYFARAPRSASGSLRLRGESASGDVLTSVIEIDAAGR